MTSSPTCHVSSPLDSRQFPFRGHGHDGAPVSCCPRRPVPSSPMHPSDTTARAVRWHSLILSTKSASPTSPTTCSALVISEACCLSRSFATCSACASETKLVVGNRCWDVASQAGEQSGRGAVKPSDIVIRPRDQHGALQTADDGLSRFAGRAGQHELAFCYTAIEHAHQPGLVDIEIFNDRFLHRRRECVIPSCQHPAQAHPAFTQHICVNLRVRLELGYRIALAPVDDIRCFCETARVALDERPAKIGFSWIVVMQAGFGDLQLGCDVGVAEAVET